MLKKDSQRRMTLSKVLDHDEAKICDVWMQKIENNHKVKVVISKVCQTLNSLSFTRLTLISFIGTFENNESRHS